MIAFRKRHPIVHRSRFFTGETNERGLPDVTWHGCQLYAPGWNDPNSRVLAYTMGGFGADPDMHVMLNMDGQALAFELPIVPGRKLVPRARHQPGIARRHRRGRPGGRYRRIDLHRERPQRGRRDLEVVNGGVSHG